MPRGQTHEFGEVEDRQVIILAEFAGNPFLAHVQVGLAHLAGNHQTGRLMGDSNGGVIPVDILAARTGGAKSFNFQIAKLSNLPAGKQVVELSHFQIVKLSNSQILGIPYYGD